MVSKAVFYTAAVISGVILAVAGNALYQNIEFENARIYFFYSDSCPKCLEVKPYVEKFAERHNLTWCNVANMDSDCSRIAKELGIRYVPSLVVVDREIRVFVGSGDVMRVVGGSK
uniref:Thioredoxin n=1 Tax=Archaeoglobus fulgidus TaxID=2234 RepID=A0A7C3VE59_ARCFL